MELSMNFTREQLVHLLAQMSYSDLAATIETVDELIGDWDFSKLLIGIGDRLVMDAKDAGVL